KGEGCEKGEKSDVAHHNSLFAGMGNWKQRGADSKDEETKVDKNECVRELELHLSAIKREDRCALACRTEYRPKSRVRDSRAGRPCHFKGDSWTGSGKKVRLPFGRVIWAARRRSRSFPGNLRRRTCRFRS